jgi:hypothetical protein
MQILMPTTLLSDGAPVNLRALSNQRSPKRQGAGFRSVILTGIDHRRPESGPDGEPSAQAQGASVSRSSLHARG